MDSMVVGIDGTEASLVALDWAAARAVPGATQVRIVMIAGTILSDDFRIDASILEAERRFRDVAPNVEVTARRVSGRMPRSLVDEAGGADLLVIGSHRGRPLRSALAGRLPARIASGSGVPVVVVPDDWAPAGGQVVVGLDDDDSSSAALETAAREADAAGVALTVVHAWKMPMPQMEGSVALLASPLHVKAEHRTMVRDAVALLAHSHPDLVVEQLLVQGEPTAALLARSAGASLLVVGTHHRGPLEGVLLGSVGQDAIDGTSVPVCIVPNEPPH